MKHSQKIERLLEDKGWSTAELARRAKVGREQARRLAIRIPPSVLGAIRVARALDVSAEWLFDDRQEWLQAGMPTGQTLNPALPSVDLPVLRRELRKLLDLS